MNLPNHPSPLITAVGVGRPSIVKLLLDHPGVDIAAEFASELTPFKTAVECWQVTMVKLLFEASQTRDFANIALERLLAEDVRHVVRDGHEDVIRVLIDAMDNINHGDDDRLIALHYACRTGRVELVELILARKDVKPGSEDPSGRTIESDANEEGCAECVRSLMI
ncbi:ankyrin repeat-containing domain protein [Aspergillus caelatus]|uniref:Ankyrin repeat-containing domain protein n=1 Tax=Aspergillus caelatus TaxID=61420 RepID=A0A5N7A6E4_9EURO|nr:ankyrin repeat-containing domain protein [Aspergillus caelatus]KAE8364766.1 ankyrin repeat-containing domain protein [Aspergillus caelatus]